MVREARRIAVERDIGYCATVSYAYEKRNSAKIIKVIHEFSKRNNLACKKQATGYQFTLIRTLSLGILIEVVVGIWGGLITSLQKERNQDIQRSKNYY